MAGSWAPNEQSRSRIDSHDSGYFTHAATEERLRLQLSGHEHAVRIFDVIREWTAQLEPEAGVKLASRRKRIHRARFQAQSPI